MKAYIALLVLTIWFQTPPSSAEYRYNRYKMPQPPRPPQPHFMKKWAMPPQRFQQQHPQMRQQSLGKPQMRPAVIPLHMPNVIKMPYPPPHQLQQIQHQPHQQMQHQQQQQIQHQQQQLIQQHQHQQLHQQQHPQIQHQKIQHQQALPSVHKPVIGIPTGPVRPYWHNIAHTTYKNPVQQHAPFQGSPAVTTEYDYHIQNNLIPTHSNLIKQVDDKGPIHTIPAPNLSLADKPIVVEEVRPESQQKINMHPQKHQYQVVENGNEQQNAYHGKKAYYAQDPNAKLNTPSPAVYQQVAVQNLETDTKDYGQQLTQQELFQFLNNYPQQQQQLAETFAIPILQQTQVQHVIPQQSGVFNTAQLFQAEPAYIAQVSQKVKDEFKPQFHTFNYEEQAPKTTDFNSRTAADFGYEPETSESVQTQVVASPTDVVSHVKQYYDVREENVIPSTNEKTQKRHKDASADEQNQNQPNPDDLTSVFYTSLPNRETAETFAALQNAGRVNNDLKENNRGPGMRIFVPDNEEAGENEGRPAYDEEVVKITSQGNYGKQQTVENKDVDQYDDFGHVDLDAEAEEVKLAENAADSQIQTDQKSSGTSTRNQIFGSRLRPKNKSK